MGSWPLVVVALLPVLAGRAGADQYVIVDIVAFLCGVAGVASAVLWLVAPRRPVRLRRLELAWATFLLVALVSLIASGRGFDAFMGEPTNLLGWGLLASLTCIAAGASAFSTQIRSILSRFGWIVVAAECLLALATISPSAVAAGTLPNSTIFGIAIVLLLPWTITEDLPSGWPTWAAWGTVLLSLATLAAVGARIALVGALTWSVWAIWTKTRIERRVKSTGTVGAIAAAIAAAVIFRGSEFASTFTSMVVGDRPAMWRMAWNGIQQRLLTGWGPDGFLTGAAASSTVALASKSHLLMVAAGATDPHDLIIWIAVSFGLLGLSAFLWFSVELVVVWRQGRVSSAALWAIACAFAVFLTAPAAVQVLPLFAMMVGLSLPPAQPPALKTKKPAAKISVLEPALMMVLLLVSVAFSADAVTRSFYEQSDAQRSVAMAPRVRSAAGFWSMDPYLSYLSSIHLAYAAPSDPSVNESRLDLIAIERAVALNSRNPFYANEYARTLRYYQEPSNKVLAAYSEVFKRYPAFPIARAEYATYLVELGQSKEAAAELKNAELVPAKGSVERDAAIDNARKALGNQAP